MITKEQVVVAMQRWELAGLVPPAGANKGPKLVESFLERFAYMDEATLEYITAKVVLGSEWPKFTVIEQLAQEYEGKNSRFVVIDYFKQMRVKAFGEKESFSDFIKRIAEKYFPGNGEEWMRKHRFTLYFYGVCCDACNRCEGTCPRNGHRYHLRIKRGTSCPVPWGSLELCDKYKASVDREGKVRKRRATLEEKAEERVASMQGALVPDDLDIDDLLPEEAKKAKEKYEEQDMFSEEAM